MPETLELVSSTRNIHAQPQLPASKSICNRLLVLEQVSNGAIIPEFISAADDSQKLHHLLSNKPDFADAGDGGTTFRFALAFFAASENYSGILTGTSRLKERPQHLLIEALRSLGAEITCLEKEGFAPVKISGKKLNGGKITIDAGVSSQFVTAILLISPMLNSPLEIELQGELVSASYLEMTIDILRKSGVSINYSGRNILVGQAKWNAGVFPVERDWSAASYWYALLALAHRGSVFLQGLHLESLQGDAICASIFERLGIHSIQESEGIRLSKVPVNSNGIDLDASNFPDLVQTLVVVCVALNIKARFSGLKTLRIKETDRLSAMQQEFRKIKFELNVEGDDHIECSGLSPDFSKTLIVETYNDHRMAMSFAALVTVVYKLAIRNPEVVSKSYPNFWKDIRESGISFAEWEG
jgi:3-phosphoshikimate 1-carboxyvinyltransferase